MIDRQIKFARRVRSATQKGRAVKRRSYQGIELRIDRPQGFVQNGKDAAGNSWQRTFRVDYGYIPGTKGGDGDGIDVYVGHVENATLAYWVLQRRPDGGFDEYKLMLGFLDRRSAKAMWEAHTPAKFYGGMATTSMGVVKALLGVEPMAIHKARTDLLTAMTMAHESEEDAPPPAVTDRMAQLAADLVAKYPELAKRDVAAVAKAEDERRYVLGIVLEPDIVDAQGDTYDADTIERAAHIYLARFRNAGLMHNQLVNHLVELVESYVAPCDLTVGDRVIKQGTWLAGFVINDDELWAQVKSGALGGLSIGGVAQKVDPVTGEPIPPPPELARFSP